MPRFELQVETQFSAAHHLRDYPGKCAAVHGHNYRVRVTVVADRLSDSGMVMDISELRGLCEEMVAPFDHKDLNQEPPFDTVNPTVENLARHFYSMVAPQMPPGVRLHTVEVWETEGAGASYSEE